MKKRMSGICFLIAALCLVYCLGVLLTKAAGTRFFLIWIVIAAAFALLGLAIRRGIWGALPGPVRTLFLTGFAICLAAFCLAQGLILSRFFAKGEQGLSYIIVLGAQMKENGPSVALAKRLDAAAGYLLENPDTVCIVSGGKGDNEPVTEASGMREYLVKKGIDPGRILLEDQSRDTAENLSFSRRLVPENVTRVGVVTSNFHIYRSTQLAKSQGFPDAVGIGASSGIYFLPNNMLRECFGIAKDWLFGNMKLIG